MRPVRFVPNHVVLGFPGKMEKGLWAIPPHRGPIMPASIPTPPELQLRMRDSTTFDLLEEEEDWLGKFKMQAVWEGELETLGGPREFISVKFDATTQPIWTTIRFPGSTSSIMIHPLLTKPVHVKDASGNNTLAAVPDPSPVQGNCILQPKVHSAPVELGEHYLPCAEELAFFRENCSPFELGKSFGIGHVTVGVGSTPVPCTYRLKIGFPTNKIVFAAHHKGARGEPDTFTVIEGELAKGISETFYMRGVYYTQIAGTKTPDSLKRPLCVFQLTIGNTVPEVVTSPMGIRYAGLKTRSFSIFAEGLKLERVC